MRQSSELQIGAVTVLVTDSPTHFSPVSTTQILKADREMFSLLAAEHSDSLKALSGQEPPLDKTFQRLMHDPRINVHLIAFPKASNATPSPKPVKREGDVGADRPAPKKPKPSPTKPAAQMPELKGLTTRTADGKPICWHRNLKKGCNNTL